MDTHKKPRKVGLNYGDHKGSHLLSTFRATHGSNPARAGTNISVPLDLDSSPDPLIAQGVSEGLREMRSPTPGGAGTRGQIGGRRKAGGASGVSNVSDTTGAGVAKKVPATPSRVSARLRAASKEPVVYSGDEENGDEDGPIGGEDEEKENKGKKKQGGVVKKGSAVKSGKAAAIRVTATTTTTTTRRSTRSKKKPPIEEGKEDEDMSKKQKKTTPEVVSSDDEDVRGWELKPTSWRRTTTYKKRGVFSSSQPSMYLYTWFLGILP